MLFTRIQLRNVSLLALVAVAQGSWLQDHLLRRQDDKSTSGVRSATTSAPTVTPTVTPTTESAPVTPTTSSDPPPAIKTTPTTSSTSSVAPQTTTIPPPATTSSQQTSQQSTSSSADSSTTNTPPAEDSPSSTSTPPRTTIAPIVSLITSIETISGSVRTTVSSSTDTAAMASASKSAEILAGKESSDEGMTTTTKNTIIGVVVGVGGAIILGGLAIVAWRIWGRRKHEDDSGDGLMTYGDKSGDNSGITSASGPGAGNPFQSTLESYHNPAKNVNASSNF